MSIQIDRYCKYCKQVEDPPLYMNWTDEALMSGYAADHYNNYICNKCYEE